MSFIFVFWVSVGHAQNVSDFKVSGPYSYQNLDVYMVLGKNCEMCFYQKPVLTLEEAIEFKKVTVYETKDVNELEIENTSATEVVFIQAGDIVKGGQQDRVLSQDLVLKPKSGKIKIGAFCVEQGRWHKRGDEKSDQFSSSKKRINSRPLKIASQISKNQSQVWGEVDATQDKLSVSTGKNVRSEESKTSLPLALENPDLKNKVNEYEKALESILKKHPDALGYVFVINGKINSGEVYSNTKLFENLWPKLLRASAEEAFAEGGQNKIVDFITQDQTERVLKFLQEAPLAPLKEKRMLADTVVKIHDSKENIFIASHPSKQKNKEDWFHFSYISR